MNDGAHATIAAARDAELGRLFDDLWQAYAEVMPLAGPVRDGLTALGNTIADDHVAFRTFDLAPLGLAPFVTWFEARGYVRTGTYAFADKQLDAVSLSYRGPADRGGGRVFPRVFFSALRTAAFSPALQAIARRLVASVAAATDVPGLLTRAPTWPAITLAEYDRLLDESEYAAWTAAFGLRANHFTVSVDTLSTHREITAVNAWLEAQGIALNTAGGAVKGSPVERLEQSSTLAVPIPWRFADGERTIPGCYYEFARRYRDDATGLPYDGFVPASADKIFESTDVRRGT